MDMDNEKGRGGFWSSLTGIITMITGFIAAVTGLIVAVNNFQSAVNNVHLPALLVFRRPQASLSLHGIVVSI
jgi:hypothetical protein